MNKIPNRKSLHDIFVNECKRYCLPLKNMTLKFGRKILAGNKKLYLISNVVAVSHIPNYPSLKSDIIWSSINGKPHNEKVELLKFSPDY